MSEIKSMINNLSKENDTGCIMTYIEFKNIYEEIINKLK